VAMAEALAVVKVGKSEWLFAKRTPCSRIQNIVGESTAFTDPARKPSKTKIRMLRGGCVAGLSCPRRKSGRNGHRAKAAAIQSHFVSVLGFLHRECIRLCLIIDTHRSLRELNLGHSASTGQRPQGLFKLAAVPARLCWSRRVCNCQ